MSEKTKKILGYVSLGMIGVGTAGAFYLGVKEQEINSLVTAIILLVGIVGSIKFKNLLLK